MTARSLASGAVVFFSLLAALLWFMSTIVRVDARDHAEAVRATSDWSPAQVVDGDGSDVVETMRRQSRWNRAAAAASGLAAIAQTVCALL